MATPAYAAKRGISPERLERCARIYPSNQEAAAALDIAPGSFSRLCIKHGIDTPQQRRRKRNANAKKQRQHHQTNAEPTPEELEALDDLLADDLYAD